MKKFLLVAINAKYIHSNLAVYSLRSYAKREDVLVDIKEYTINMQKDEVLSDIYVEAPDVLFVSCYIWNIEFVKDVIREFHKLRPQVPIWLGGPEVSYDVTEFLSDNEYVYGVMMGEGEKSFTQVCKAYLRDDSHTQEHLADIDGIAYRDADNGDIIINQKSQLLSMDEIPFCYDDMEIPEDRIIYYETSRGCPFSCSYCLSSIDKRLRLRSLELVYSELQFFLDKNVKQVKFVDRTFNCDHAHAQSIWRYINEHDNGITNFHFEVSADLLNDEEIKLLSSMRKGLVQLEIGIQTTNQDTLKEIRRTMNLSRLKDAFYKVKETKKVHQHLDLIAGLPYEGYDSFRESFDEIYELKCEQLQLGFLKVLKGSYMHEMADEYGIVYNQKPPYEVMATRWLSYDELLRIKIVEQMLEIHYNSGQFLTSLSVLEKCFESPFEMYLEMGLYFKKMGYVNPGYSRVKRTEMFYEYAVNVDPDRARLYKEALLHDLYKRERAKGVPGFVDTDGDDAKWDSKLPGRILKELGKDHRYCQVKPYHYNVWALENDEARFFEEPVWVLYDYENKTVTPLLEEIEND